MGIAGSLTGQKETYVELDTISENLQISATEDRLYKNSRINYGRFFLAILTLGRSVVVRLSQQLIRMLICLRIRRWNARPRNSFTAINKKYSKEILTMYLNNTIWEWGLGIEDASKKYFWGFSQSIKLGSVRVLAGMLKGAWVYNPLFGRECDRSPLLSSKIWWQLVILTRKQQISLLLSVWR